MFGFRRVVPRGKRTRSFRDVTAGLAIVALAAACTVSTSLEPTPSGPGGERVQEGTPTEGTVGTVSTEGSRDQRPDQSTSPDASAAADGAADVGTNTPDEILGTLSGSCGAVKTLLDTASPTFETNALSFVSGEEYERDALSPDGQRMFDTPNAGGTSTESEVMSLEVLRACEGAKLLKTETEISYVDDDAGPRTITDILVEIAGKKVGVSVTRAYKPQNMSFPDADVKALLEKKLEGIVRSSARVATQDRWVKQILHVFAATKAQADAVARVLPTIAGSIRRDTIVLLTQTKGGGFVYCNPDPPLGSECP
ncbi:MAG TPA: hypothetical protein VM925_18615 [Labilithrix sp.]|nr:hypothetical protein [Labilithrix sp.]